MSAASSQLSRERHAADASAAGRNSPLEGPNSRTMSRALGRGGVSYERDTPVTMGFAATPLPGKRKLHLHLNLLSSLLLSRLELSDTQVYEPHIRALLGTTSHGPQPCSRNTIDKCVVGKHLAAAGCRVQGSFCMVHGVRMVYGVRAG